MVTQIFILINITKLWMVPIVTPILKKRIQDLIKVGSQMIACVQVGEYFPLLQRSLHSFPRQQCDRPQGSGNHHHPPRPNQHHHYQVHHHRRHHHEECPCFQEEKKLFISGVFQLASRSWTSSAGLPWASLRLVHIDTHLQLKAFLTIIRQLYLQLNATVTNSQKMNKSRYLNPLNAT